MSIFTYEEKTIKKHSVGFIATQARSVLNDKNIKGMCTNNLPSDYGQLYTTEKASEIIDSIVFDSIFYK